jgi:hypothetical protein
MQTASAYIFDGDGADGRPGPVEEERRRLREESGSAERAR